MLNKNSILVVVAHPDDEVLGCGGFVSKLSEEGNTVHLLVISDGESSRETKFDNKSHEKLINKRNKCLRASGKILGFTSIETLNFPDNRLDSIDLLDLIKEVEKRLKAYKPNLVITHHYGDLNIDHRLVNEATCVACRPVPGSPIKEIIFFETPSSSEWQIDSNKSFYPNFFVDISGNIEKKLNALECYQTELREFPHPRSLKALKNIAIYRGATIGCNFAEAFVIGRRIF